MKPSVPQVRLTALLVSFVSLAMCSSCSTPRTSESSLSALWETWEPIHPPLTIYDHEWLVGWWRCSQRQLAGERTFGEFVYMKVDDLHEDFGFNQPHRFIFSGVFLRVRENGQLIQAFMPAPFAYHDGFYTLGNPSMCDWFYMRRNPKTPTQEFILRHELGSDYLLLVRLSEHEAKILDDTDY